MSFYMKKLIYTVHAYKYGDRQLHSYSVGVFQKKHAALKCADDETEYRGGKYECEVIEWFLGSVNEDGSPGTLHKIIKTLPFKCKVNC